MGGVSPGISHVQASSRGSKGRLLLSLALHSKVRRLDSSSQDNHSSKLSIGFYGESSLNSVRILSPQNNVPERLEARNSLSPD